MKRKNRALRTVRRALFAELNKISECIEGETTNALFPLDSLSINRIIFFLYFFLFYFPFNNNSLECLNTKEQQKKQPQQKSVHRIFACIVHFFCVVVLWSEYDRTQCPINVFFLLRRLLFHEKLNHSTALQNTSNKQ